MAEVEMPAEAACIRLSLAKGTQGSFLSGARYLLRGVDRGEARDAAPTAIPPGFQTWIPNCEPCLSA
jgi:hypothetical protein